MLAVFVAKVCRKLGKKGREDATNGSPPPVASTYCLTKPTADRHKKKANKI